MLTFIPLGRSFFSAANLFFILSANCRVLALACFNIAIDIFSFPLYLEMLVLS